MTDLATPPLPVDHLDLPDLPDLDTYVEAAQQRVRYFTRMRDEAQAEIDRAQRWIDAARPQRRTPSGRRPNGSLDPLELGLADGTYQKILQAIGNHNGCSIPTIANEAKVSGSTAARALRQADALGHARGEEGKRRRRKWWLTDAGRERATGPVEQVRLRVTTF